MSWNEKFSIKTDFNEFKPREEIANFKRDDWDNLSEEDFKKIFKGSAVKRTKYVGLKRNIGQN